MEATIFSGWIYDHLLPHARLDQGGSSVDAASDRGGLGSVCAGADFLMQAILH
jgi:hypothetical protein